MDKLNGKENGFSTIELIIAMAIMVLALTSVVLVSFGNQSFLIGSQANSEAVKIAQRLLEQEQAYARKDFNLVNSTPNENLDATGFCPIGFIREKSKNGTDDIFCERVEVSTKPPDYVIKEITALVTWRDGTESDKKVKLDTLITNFDIPFGGNTCDSNLSGDWSNPQVENNNFNAEDMATLVGDPLGTYTISDVDVYNGLLYVTASKVSNSTKSTFFIFDISDPAHPTLKSNLDNEVSGGTTSVGLSAVRVSEDSATHKTYAYAANAFNANFTTCNPAAVRNCGQLDIFDVSDPSHPSLGANLKIASAASPFVKGSQAHGNSIFYRNGYLLLGLASTGAGNGPEFHIIDVHDPASYFSGTHILSPIGSFAIGNDINAIAMRGNYMYVVTPNAQELQILDVSNPTAPSLAGGFAVGSGNGKSIYTVGDNLFLGKTTGAGDDFFILDNTNPSTTLPQLGGVNIGDSVNAVIVRDYLSFVLTNNKLQIYRTDDLSHISLFAALSLPSSGSSTEPSMDCEGNRMYISSNDSSGKGAIYIIKPGP